jgi:Ni/Fe-hydrogenase subunit HybB-like protein
MTKWQEDLPIYGIPVLNRTFWKLLALVIVALFLTTFREFVGLGGAVSGMSDPYAWGLWKTFNVMVLTGLGSGGFAVGIAAWVFHRIKLHSVMRVALLTSFLAYSTGLIMLGIDVGRPWNFYWILMPWHWNLHSPLLEVAVCISFYATVPLLLENIPPLLEYVIYQYPQWHERAEAIERTMRKFLPWVVSLAYILPIMHQSSLGALMLLAGDRVHPLWQTPFLPLLYVWAAAFLGYNCVTLCLLHAKLAWKRDVDPDVMAELTRLTCWIVFGWSAFRLADIVIRGKLMLAFAPSLFALTFWIEMILITGSAFVLYSAKGKNLRVMYLANSAMALGGLIYRFSPTTLAFRPRDAAMYFPSAIELLISLGFVALAALGYLVAVKKLDILPGSYEEWFKYTRYEERIHPGIKLTGYASMKH